jgi:hypothetical protein
MIVQKTAPLAEKEIDEALTLAENWEFVEFPYTQGKFLARAYRALKSQLAEVEGKLCQKCHGTGEADSGGVTLWDAGINVKCECQIDWKARAESAENRVKELEQAGLESNDAHEADFHKIIDLTKERDAALSSLTEAKKLLDRTLKHDENIAPGRGLNYRLALEITAFLNSPTPASQVMGRVGKLERVAELTRKSFENCFCHWPRSAEHDTDGPYSCSLCDELGDALADLDKQLTPKQGGET